MNIRIVVVLLLIFSSCVFHSKEDYYRKAYEEGVKQGMIYSGMRFEDHEWEIMRFYNLREAGNVYKVQFYGVVETGDTFFITVPIDKKWPYFVGGIAYNGVFRFLYKTRRSLKNLFPVLERDSARLERRLFLEENERAEWLLGVDKIGDYIKRGHYYILERADSTRLIEFYVPVAKSRKLGYDEERVYLRLKNDTTISLLPYPTDFLHSKLDGSLWDMPFLIATPDTFAWNVDKEKLRSRLIDGEYQILGHTGDSYVLQVDGLSGCMRQKNKSKWGRSVAKNSSIRITVCASGELKIEILDLPWDPFRYRGLRYKPQKENGFKIYQYRVE